MARFYTINNLLDQLLREGGSELRILAETPPLIILPDRQITMDAVCITEENITELLYNMATVEQMKELKTCGDVHFIYLFRNWVRFAVTASVAHNNRSSIQIKNLGR